MSIQEFTNTKEICDYVLRTRPDSIRALGDYPMIDSVNIQNIRGFESVEIEGLKQFNVVVGQSAGGKTALLESIYLGAGQPALSLKLDLWRGVSEQFFGLNPATLSDLWANLFYRDSMTASVSLRGTDFISRKLEISLGETETVVVSSDNKLKDVEQMSPISFQWFEDDREITAKIRPEIELNILKFPGAPEPFKVAFYSSANPISARETGNWFSQLSKERRVDPLIKIVKAMFPFIKDLNIEVHNNIGMVHANIKGMPKKIPLGLVSGGINKLMSLLVAIPHQKVLLIDEIENGFYYKTMPNIWSALYKVAKEYDTQILAATHSWECLRALAGAMKGKEKEYKLLRSRREPTGRCAIDTVAGKSLKAAIDEQMEIR